MTDTPPITHPPSKLDVAKAFIGDLARPFAIISTSACASAAMVIMSLKVENGNDGSILMGAIGVLSGGIFLGKAWEVTKTGKQAADVEIAKQTTQ